MIKNLRNTKMENINIEWNAELFRGMKYSEIVQFKKKYKKLVVKHYKLAVKKQEVEAKLLQAKEDFMSKGTAKKAAPKAFRIVVGGLAIATVCAVAPSAIADKSNNYVAATNSVATVTIEDAVMENVVAETIETIEETSTENVVAEAIEEINIVEEENFYNIETTSEETEAEYTYGASYVYETVEEIAVPTTETTIEDVTSVAEENVEDIIIFDKAIEMLTERCEASENGNIFKGDYNPQFVRVMGNFILPSYNDMADYKLAGWFEAFFGSEALTYELRYNTSFAIKEGGAKFENTEDGFKVLIDKSAVNAVVNLDIDDAMEASARGGVSKNLRDYLLSEECHQFLPSIHKVMEGTHSNVKKEVIESDAFYETVKSSIENELKNLTSWDVEVVFR